MAKPIFMRIDKNLKKELLEIKKRGRKASLSDVVREMMMETEYKLKRRVK